MEQDRIAKAREILGDGYVFVTIDRWNQSVDDYKKLAEENKKLKEDNPVDEDGFIICPNCGRIKIDQ